MKSYMYVKSYLALTCLSTFPHPTIQRSNRNASRPLQRLQIRQGQSTLREATRMGFSHLPIIDWMPFPPLLASYGRQYVARSHMSTLVHAGYPSFVLVLRPPYLLLVLHWHGQCTPVTPHPFSTVPGHRDHASR